MKPSASRAILLDRGSSGWNSFGLLPFNFLLTSFFLCLLLLKLPLLFFLLAFLLNYALLLGSLVPAEVVSDIVDLGLGFLITLLGDEGTREENEGVGAHLAVGIRKQVVVDCRCLLEGETREAAIIGVLPDGRDGLAGLVAQEIEEGRKVFFICSSWPLSCEFSCCRSSLELRYIDCMSLKCSFCLEMCIFVSASCCFSWSFSWR